MNTKKEKDSTTKMEIQDAIVWAENKSDEELDDALILALRNQKYEDIILGLTKHIEKLLKDIPRTLKSEVRAYLYKLQSLHNIIINKIAETLEEMCYRMPDNTYNLKEALGQFSKLLYQGTQMDIEFASALLISEIYPTNSNSAIYTGSDLENEYQKGFEAGYQRCLDNSEIHKVDERLSDLDLS